MNSDCDVTIRLELGRMVSAIRFSREADFEWYQIPCKSDQVFWPDAANSNLSKMFLSLIDLRTQPQHNRNKYTLSNTHENTLLKKIVHIYKSKHFYKSTFLSFTNQTELGIKIHLGFSTTEELYKRTIEGLTSSTRFSKHGSESCSCKENKLMETG